MHYSVKGSNNMTGGCRRVVFYCIKTMSAKMYELA